MKIYIRGLAMKRQIVIRRPFWGNMLFVLGCAVFVVAGLLMQQGEDSFYRLIGVASIVFFGGGGLCYLAFLAWKPIVVVSSDGIIVPYGWSKSFVLWENINRFEVMEQVIHAGRGGRVRQKYIGIFVFNKEEIVGTGKVSQSITQGITDWKEVPAMLIVLSFSFVKIEKVMKILQEFHDNYKIADRTK